MRKNLQDLHTYCNLKSIIVIFLIKIIFLKAFFCVYCFSQLIYYNFTLSVHLDLKC